MTLKDVTLPVRPSSLPAIVVIEQAHEEMLARFAAVPDDRLVFMNIDPPVVVTTLVNHAERIESLIPQAQKVFADFNAEPFQKLRTRAMALQQAHALYLASTEPEGEEASALQESGSVLRVRLNDDAQYLVKRGFLDGKPLEAVRFLLGSRNLATELMVLANVLRQAGPAVLSRCAVEPGDLDKAAVVATRLFDAAAQREKNSRGSEAALMRQRAYSFVFHEYDWIRSVVSFLRWEQGDADDFAPSLFAGRGNTRRKSKSDEAPAPAPGPTGGSPVAPGETKVDKVPAGYPGGSPFIDG